MEDTVRGEDAGVSEEEEEEGVEGPGVIVLRFRTWVVRWGLVVRDSGCSCSV